SFVDDAILHAVADFLAVCHLQDEPFSVRDGINIARYVAKRCVHAPKKPLRDLLSDAVAQILGEDAVTYLKEPQ
ncbi:MAG: MoxR family ATPase, partial [Deltaproteobacteria bacterium]